MYCEEQPVYLGKTKLFDLLTTYKAGDPARTALMRGQNIND